MIEKRIEHNQKIKSHFEPLVADYPRLKSRNSYYNDYFKTWCRSLIPSGKKILDLGCGLGDVLDQCKPTLGVGIDLCPSFISKATQQYPHLKFENTAIEDFQSETEFDAVLLIQTMEYVHDIGVVFEKARSVLRDNGRLYITTANPLWSPIFKLASKLNLRIPESDRLFVTNEDVVNMLKLHGFEVSYKKTAMLIPKYIPLLTPLLNWVFPRIPYLRQLCSTQLIVARKLPKRKEYSVSVIVPCHNEAGNVERCVKEMIPLGKKTELIFVDDGSTDGTADKVPTALRTDIDVKVIRYEKNQGKGVAVKTGFDAATGDILMILDADLTTHPEELNPLYEAFATGRAEFVNCTRLIYPMEDGSMKFLNFVGNKLFTLLVSFVMETRVSDTLCGTKAMFRWDYYHYRMGRDPWGDYDLLFGAAEQRHIVTELPVHYRERIAGVSKMNSTKHTINLLKMCWYGFWQVKTMKPLKVSEFDQRNLDQDATSSSQSPHPQSYQSPSTL